MSGPEKEEWVMEAVDKIWYNQTDHHLIADKKGKKKVNDDSTVGDIEDLIRQLIQQICIATKGGVGINRQKTSLQKSQSIRFGGTFKKRDSHK